MRDEKIAGHARSWWKAFIEPDHSAARANRARLRRAQNCQEALLEPAAIVLAERLGVANNDRTLPVVLRLAHVLAHVKQDTQQPLMQSLGYKSLPTEKDKGDPPRLAPVRFSRLLRSTPDELPLALVRLVRLADDTANVGELAVAMMRWATESGREIQRRRWAFDYYAASEVAPDACTDPNSQETEGAIA